MNWLSTCSRQPAVFSSGWRVAAISTNVEHCFDTTLPPPWPEALQMLWG